LSALVKILGAYAPGHSIDHKGKTITFGRVEKRTRAALTVAYFKRQREAVYATRGEVSDEEFDRALARVTDAYAQGQYDFPLGASYRYFVTAGMPELVAQLTGCDLADAEALVDERTIEVLHIVTCVLAESNEPLKKTLLSLPDDDPQARTLISLLSSSNGSPSPKPTTPPRSPSAA
jgi:hypothetical protein